MMQEKRPLTCQHLNCCLTPSLMHQPRRNVINISVLIRQASDTLKQSVKDRLGPLLNANSEFSHSTSVASQVCECVFIISPRETPGWVCFHMLIQKSVKGVCVCVCINILDV